jgi:hypothetical protein
MSYISRSTRELRGKGRGQKPGAETRGRDRGQRIGRHLLSSLSPVYRSLYPCAESGPMILGLDFLFFVNIAFRSLKYRGPSCDEKQEVWCDHHFWFLVPRITSRTNSPNQIK